MRLALCLPVFALALLACSEPTHPPTLDTGKNIPPPGGSTQSDASADAAAGVQSLATADHPHGIAVGSGYVYFTNYVTGAPGEGWVGSVPAAGGASTLVANSLDGPWALALTSTDVVFTTSPASGTGGVYSVPQGGGAVAALETNLLLAVGVVVDSTNAYWVDQNGGLVVERATLDGGTPQEIGNYGGVVDPAGLALSGLDLYFSGSGPNGGAFHVVATGDGGVADVLDAPQSLPFAGVAVDTTKVYVAIADDTPAGQILAYPRGGGVPVVLATGLDRPTSLALDGANLYFTSPRAGTVSVVSTTGGTPQVVADGLKDPVPLAVGDALYVGVDDAVLRIPK